MQEFDKLLENQIGFNLYQLIVITLLCMIRLNDGCQVDGWQIILPIVTKKNSLSNSQLTLLSSLFYIGMMIGAPLGGLISDKYGRKIGLVIACTQTIFVSLLIQYSDNLIIFAIVRFCSGYCYSFSSPIPNSIAAEIISIKWRGKVQLILNIFITVGRVFAAMLVYFYISPDLQDGNWKMVLIVSPLFTLISLLGVYKFFKETPRYLIANGRIDQAVKSINYMINFSYQSKQLTDYQINNIRKDYLQQYKSQNQRSKFSSLFLPRYRRQTIIFAIQKYSLYTMYYGTVAILPFIAQKQKSPFTIIYSALSEFPTLLITIPIIDYQMFGRRNSMLYLGIIVTLCQFACIYDLKMLNVSRFFMKTVLAIIVPLIVESYGTLNRTIGFSFSQTVGRLGPAFMSYYLFAIYDSNPDYVFVFFGTLAVLTVLTTALLPKDKTNQAVDCEDYDSEGNASLISQQDQNIKQELIKVQTPTNT